MLVQEPTHADLINHLASEHNFRENYPCDHCPEQFETQSKLNRHMSESHPEKEPTTYPCTLCNKILPSFPSLKIHLRIHEGGAEEAGQTMVGIRPAFSCRWV